MVDIVISEIMALNKQRYFLNGQRPTAFLKTYGCQQNENDSEYIGGMLSEMGYVMTDDHTIADIIVYNTCCIRESAEQKIYGNLGALKHFKKPDAILVVCGCMVQRPEAADFIRKKFRHVDLIFGPHVLDRFPSLLKKVMEDRQAKYALLDTEENHGLRSEMPILRKSRYKALVSIMFGCNNFCSYCIVPYVRGRERSRPFRQILKEVSELSKDGCREIMLLGQNVNSYSYDGFDFSDLIDSIDRLNVLDRIRFMTSHPKDISDKLIDVIKKGKNICKSIHLPVQAGSDKVLSDMNRGYTVKKYLEIIDKLRKIDNMTVSTDIIAGFPTETQEDFEKTLDLIRQAQFDFIFTFNYSKRSNTKAAELDDILSREERTHNFNRLLSLQEEISYSKNQDYLGEIVRVFVEDISKTSREHVFGRTDNNKLVNIRGGSGLIGKFVDVKIVRCRAFSLEGELYGDN